MRAVAVFHEKRLLLNRATNTAAIAELKIWSVPSSKDYPHGIKFSLFLVSGGAVIVGIDITNPRDRTSTREIVNCHISTGMNPHF
jgi:hypothetical protein